MMKVKCIKKEFEDDITIGKNYEVLSIEENMVRIIDDEGDVSYCSEDKEEPNGYLYDPELFEIVEDKDNKLKKLYENINKLPRESLPFEL